MFWALILSRAENNILKFALQARGASSAVGRAQSHEYFPLKLDGLQPTREVYIPPKGVQGFFFNCVWFWLKLATEPRAATQGRDCPQALQLTRRWGGFSKDAPGVRRAMGQ